MKGPLDLARALTTKAEHDLRMAEIGIDHKFEERRIPANA